MRTTPDGEHVITHVEEPSITPYLPAAGNGTGAAVIIIPGGGHREIWIEHEGYAVAQWLSSHGVAAFILEYRLARAPGSTYTVEGTELGDASRAIRLVRSRSRQWGLDPDHIGVMGFSSGGELAELASSRYTEGRLGAADPIDRVSSKPDFQALLYPGIPHDPRLTAHTPPAFMACGGQDRADISQGLAKLYLEFEQMHLSAELHVFAGVGHGFGIRASNTPPVSDWPLLFLQWMAAKGLLSRGPSLSQPAQLRPAAQ
jgi:endo-1,4-beta-xylanase